jgi:Protein of unknown function (DUF2924)
MRRNKRQPEIEDLPALKATQLQAIHRELFGVEHPISNCQHLRRKIAWQMQAVREGGSLPEPVRQYAISIARGTELRSRIAENVTKRHHQLPLNQTAITTIIEARDSRLPMPGSLIVKTYKGETIVIKVLDAGFEYDGRRFTSLSAVAAEITGTRWNGFAFFGLEKKRLHGG